MARITLDHIRHAYGPNPKTDKDYSLKEVDHEWNDGGAYALLGRTGGIAFPGLAYFRLARADYPGHSATRN